MTKTAFFRDFAAFRAEIANDERDQLARLAMRRDQNAKSFAERARAAAAERRAES